MRFDVITLHPEPVESYAAVGVLGRGCRSGIVGVHAHQLRDHGLGRHRQVDDTTFGGGAGMLLRPEPLADAIASVRHCNSGPIVFFEPWGERFTQEIAREFSQLQGLVLVCGRYEGIDERILEEYADRVLSIGPFVLTGAELPALTVIDATARLLPGVVHDSTSLEQDSFGDGDGGYPQYTRPVEFHGRSVPEVLRNGNHAEIARWRKQHARG